MSDGVMITGWRDEDWDDLLRRISEGKCTPFIGPGARTQFPDADEIATRWARQFQYPLGDCLDLPKVARYVAVTRDPMKPKEEIALIYDAVKRPDFSSDETADEPHRVLAELPFHVYITTNQDDLMWLALESRRSKEPRRDLCRWSDSILEAPPPAFDGAYLPTAARPLLFHLYGYTDYPQSLVVTDDNYLEFLINVSRDQSATVNRIMPSRIERAMSGASLLLGYRLDDWDFRVLFHIIISHMVRGGMTHIAVQLTPTEGKSASAQEEEVKKHLDVYQTYVGKYLASKNPKIHVSLQTCQQFVLELRKKWKDSPYARQ